MAILAPRARSLLARLRKTPLHPQWLLADDTESAPEFLSLAHGHVLDIGCANRRVEKILPQGCHYLGLDYPATGTALYRARPDILADAAQIPLCDNSMDTVLMLDVMEHLRLPHKALLESERVLRRGGRLLISIPFLYPLHDEPHDYQRLTIHGLRRDVELAGLRLEWIKSDNGSAESAGLLVCLAIAGSVHEAWVRRSLWLIAAPIMLALIPMVNLVGWSAGKFMPSWPALTSGYRLVAIKL